eukprot:jgi/Tetstr1/463961/TSEL_008766.t1
MDCTTQSTADAYAMGCEDQRTERIMKSLDNAKRFLDGVSDSLENAISYMSSDDACTAFFMKMHVTITAIVVIVLAQIRGHRLPWYRALGCVILAPILMAVTWELPMTGIPAHASLMACAVALILMLE